MGWPVTYAAGKLRFNAHYNYTIPNQAVAVIEWGFTQLWTPTVVSQNRETTDAEIPYPSVQKGKTAMIPLIITGEWSVAGSPFANSVQGLMTNVGQLNSLVSSTLTGDGRQSVTFTPYTGATPINGYVQVMPVDLGTGAKQGGTKAVLELRLPSGPLT